MTKIFLLAVIALSLSFAFGSPATSGKVEDGVVPGEFLVKYAEGAEPLAIRNARSASYNERLGLWRVSVNPANHDAAEAALASDPRVELVQPQLIYTHAAAPNDPLYQARQYAHFRAINLHAAWDAGVPPNEVLVAVIDGGTDVDHPELDSRIWSNPGEVVNGLDDDGNGCIDDITGCSFQSAPADGDIADRDGHGTFIAGLIAAESDNGEGVAGIAQNARIMPVRALNSAGQGTTEQLAESILYAARNGADILNLSLITETVGFTCPTDAVVELALQEAVEVLGATAVAAAGNFGLPCVGYPASSPYTIGVGGSGPPESTDSRAPFAHWGPEVDVAAPAERLVSTCPDPTPETTPYCPGDPYGEGDGTSFSTPIVAGVAALLLGSDPTLTPEQVRQRLMDSARPVPDGNHPNWNGAGIIDAGAALGVGSAWSSIDTRGDDLGNLVMKIVVGDPANPICETTTWNGLDYRVSETASAFGVGECAEHWPPTPSVPWNLSATMTGGKSGVVNAWRLSSGDETCHALDVPANVPVGAEVSLTIDCANAGTVHNDDPSAPVAVSSVPGVFQQELRYASSLGEPIPSCGFASRTGWYRIPAAIATAGMAVDTFGAAFDSILAVYRDDGGTLTEVACNDDAVSQVDDRSRVVFAGDGVSDYLVQVGASGFSSVVTARVNFSRAHIPANDSVTSPTALSVGDGVHVQPVHSASAYSTDPALVCAGAYGSSVWFSITSTASGPTSITTAGSTYDTVVGVFEGATPVACNDQEAPNVNTSRATWNAVGGATYTIVVGAVGTAPPGVLHVEAVSGP